VTESVTEVDGEVPAPLEQTSVYVSVPVPVGVMVCEPLAGKLPDQLPDAVQFEAFEEDQVIVVDPPVTIELEARVKVGAAGTGPVTVSVTDVVFEVPDAFEHTIE
jgi:hypothetical protein